MPSLFLPRLQTSADLLSHSILVRGNRHALSPATVLRQSRAISGQVNVVFATAWVAPKKSPWETFSMDYDDHPAADGMEFHDARWLSRGMPQCTTSLGS